MSHPYGIIGYNENETKGNKMNFNKQIKSELWDVYYKLEEAGASKVVKYAIIDVMILMDKEEEKKLEKKEISAS